MDADGRLIGRITPKQLRRVLREEADLIEDGLRLLAHATGVRGAVLAVLDNPQINYLTAHSPDKFYVILMNQSPETERVKVMLDTTRALRKDLEEDPRVMYALGFGDRATDQNLDPAWRALRYFSDQCCCWGLPFQAG